ncbi:MAG TPA: ATP-binding protein [Telmatospirillum sp.]|nr:ATP-binding protein [Telmatospirillum sp.]
MRDDLDDLVRAEAWLADRLRGLALPDDMVSAIRICAEEALSNVAIHAFDNDGEDHAILLRLTVSEAEVILVVEDAGAAFDPLAAEPTAMPLAIEDISIGGQGLVLIKAFAGRLDYERKAERNIFTMAFARPCRSGF